MLDSVFISPNPLLSDIFVSPGPIIFQWGFLTVRWYGLLIASAVIIGVNLSQYLAKQRDINPLLIQKLVIWLVVAAIPCARLYWGKRGIRKKSYAKCENSAHSDVKCTLIMTTVLAL
jgi:prolipoprotein diacylglyceryltransferase